MIRMRPFLRSMAVIAATVSLSSVPVHAKGAQLVAAKGGDVRALVVGIDKYGRSIPNLKGAAADARDFEKTLRDAGVKDLTVLVDDGATCREACGTAGQTNYDAANRRNFEAAMTRLTAVAKSGDLVVISFAGHGSQLPELVKGSEVGGKDEIFVLSGYAASGDGTTERVIDDEMNHWLLALEKKKVDVLYIADTCHGGGMMRAADFRSEVTYRFVPISMEPQGDKLKPISTPADAKVSSDDLPNVTFLAAVNKESKAPEVNIPLQPTKRGALSYAVARSISDGQDGPVTRQQLFGFARQVTYQYSDAKQTIETEPTANATLDKVIFVLKKSEAEPLAVALDPVRLRVVGNAVALTGLNAGQNRYRLVSATDDADLIWDAEKAEALNGYGDVIARNVIAKDVPPIADAAGAMLAIGKLSEGSIQAIRLLPDDRLFRQGQMIKFHVEGVKGKFLTLVNLSVNGTVQFLFPREKNDVPQMTSEDFDLPLRVTGPFGADRLIAIVSDRRLDTTEAALGAIDGQTAAAKLVGVLRSVRVADRSARIGMAVVFTAP